jgi:Radical SAM superfamily
LRKLRITVLDLVTKGPTGRLYNRIMNANLASVMPQAIAVWCEEFGHEVRYICYTGTEDLIAELSQETDVLFIGAFTRSGQTAYALSNLARRGGAVTVLGGPHARCYPQDAARYFDYVLGFTDKSLIADLLRDVSVQRPLGVQLQAKRQPAEIPNLRARWKFVEATVAKAPFLKIVPMIGSMGCPYTCSFCIDSVVPYQPLPFDDIRDDLRFLTTRMRRPRVGWHDPNFGVRFDEYMDVIESAIRPGSVRFIAESSLSLLSEEHVRRLSRNGFDALLPGIESWYDLGNKSKTGARVGAEKVRQVAEHVNMILRHVPFVQTNFVLGLDCDEGPEPFELTKLFLDLTPGTYPAFSLLTAYGQAAPLNLKLQRDGRVLPFPFHFLDSNHAMNVRPLNYGWREFYDHAVGLTRYALKGRMVRRRFLANRGITTRLHNGLRAVTSNRAEYQGKIRQLMDSDPEVSAFVEGETMQLPKFYEKRIRKSLGPLWEFLPEGALMHDQNAYLNSQKVGFDTARSTRIRASHPAAVSPLLVERS